MNETGPYCNVCNHRDAHGFPITADEWTKVKDYANELRARVAALEAALRRIVDPPPHTFPIEAARAVLSAGAVPTGEEKR